MPSQADILSRDADMLQALAGKTFLVTGARGMLGSAFSKQLRRHVPTATVHALGKAELDVRQTESLRALGIRPDFVLHCAGLVDADRCEDHPQDGAASIVDGTRNVVDFSRACGAKILYPQSFLVFDGTSPVIDESTVPRPLGVYGQLKLQAERLVLDDDANALSVRMAGFFGGEQADNNFVGRIVPHLAKLVAAGTTSIDIGNRVWQPTYTDDLAANSLLLLASGASGIYCMASHGSASFHDLACEIVKVLELEARIEIRQIDASVLAARERAKRPQSAIMHNTRMQAQDLDRQRPWQAALSDYLNQPYFKDLFR